MDLKTKIIAGVGIALVIILSQNTGSVTFQFFFWQISMSKVILAPLLILTGGAIGFLLGKNYRDRTM